MKDGVKRRGAGIGRASAYALLAALGVAAVVPAAAQVRGLPVYNAGVARGIGLSADVGLPNEDAGKGLAYGVSGSAGMGLLGLTATVAMYNPDGPAGAKAAVGGTVDYRVFGGPLIPLAVTLQGGVGYYNPEAADVSEFHIPVGIGFALTIPNPALAIRPWLAPRVDIVLHNLTGVQPQVLQPGGQPPDASTDTHFGLSGGVELNFLNGFGLHAAYDFVKAGDLKPGVFGVGAHYALRLPFP
jgi:hypothetical protein